MAKIPSVPSLSVPSWSWMGYDGGIDFLDLPLGGVHWSADAIKSPWATGGADTWHTGDGNEFVELKAQARPFATKGMGQAAQAAQTAQGEVELVCDSQDMVDLKCLMCVVMGREKKNGAIDETVHFVLVVTRTKEPLKSKEGNTLYERVGVGRVKGKDLDLKSPPQAIVIR